MKHRNDIQGLRAIAVLLVIFAHVGITGFAGGWIGVDVFFVISGFLITGLLIREYDEVHHVSLLQFYIRRAKRILPASLVTIVVVVIAGDLLLNSIRAANIHSDAIWAVGFVSNLRFIKINADYFTSSQAVSPLQHFWSLAVEEQFYLIWPALFLLISRQHGVRILGRKILRNQRILAVATIASALSLLWSISYTSSNPTSAYFSTLTRVWELGFGVLLACSLPQIHKLIERWTEGERSVVFSLASWIGIAAIILGACVLIKPGDPFPGYLALIPVLGAVGIIFGGLDEKQPLPNRLLSIQPLPFIGTISFSLYLWHWPIHVFADALYPDSANTTIGIISQLAVILAISLVSYYLIENPTRHLKIGQKSLEPKSLEEISKFPVAAVAVMAVGAAFLFVVSTDASKSRTTDAVIAMESADATGPTSTSSTLAGSAPAVTVDSEAIISGWQEKVRQGLEVTKMTPELDKAIGELSNQTVFENCIKSKVGCTAGAINGSKTVALIGDSHAAEFLRTFKVMLPDWKIRIYERPSCGSALIDPGPKSSDPNEIKACANDRQSFLDDIVANPPDLLVISDELYWVPTRNMQDDWVTAATDTFNQLKPIADRTTIVNFTSTPGYGANGWENCLTAGSSLARCFADPARVNEMADLQRQVAATAPWVHIVDIIPFLCGDSECPAVIDGDPVYIEGNHLTYQLREKLAGPIGASIIRIDPRLTSAVRWP